MLTWQARLLKREFQCFPAAERRFPAAERPNISVVIPAPNEAKNLPHVLPRIPSWVDPIMLVDGHPTDNTVVVAQSILPNIEVIQQDRSGKGAALRCGFQQCRGDIITTLSSFQQST